SFFQLSDCFFIFLFFHDMLVYLITAPKYLRLDASEKVVIQLFGYTEETNVQVCLKSSMDGSHTKYAEQIVTLNAQNNFQDAVTLRVVKKLLGGKTATHAFLQVHSEQFVKHVRIPVLRKNGFLFIQTDKTIYTPEQSVKVRAFSLNEDLMPGLRQVTLTFRDPELQKVEIVDLTDVNGIPTMQNPFKIPLKPKLGIWRIEASYTNEFTTEAKAEFEVKEYVLPSLSINMEPEANYISFGSFESFKIKISARYIHGAPVVNADVFLRFGYIEQRPGQTAVLLPKSLRREQVRTLSYSAVSFVYLFFKTSLGGISQEAELAGVKFLKSPYSLSLVATSPFIKPGLPYTIRVSVKDNLGEPVERTPVSLVEAFIKRKGTFRLCELHTSFDCSLFIIYLCNAVMLFQFKTADERLPESSQAQYTLEAMAYSSPNERYLYIDLPSTYAAAEVGSPLSIVIYFYARSYLQIENFSYQIISRGKIVKFATEKHGGSTSQAIIFQVTRDMVPSIRLLVYYVMHGEGTSELVADSVWIDVKEKCVNGLKTELSFHQKEYKPKDVLTVEVKTGQDSLVALSAVDTAVYSLRASQDPLTSVLRHIEQSDQGCGGGGGKDNADVFRLAGLTFMTNANAQASQSEGNITVKVCFQNNNPTLFIFKYFEVIDGFNLCCFHAEVSFLFDLLPTQIRSYFPESWLWEVQPVSSGICVADPIRISVTQAVSIDVPLPYSMVRGEQIKLKGSVYNQAEEIIQVRSTTRCDKYSWLESGSVGLITFTLMALEVGSHPLTFTLRTKQQGMNDQIIKTLRVVVSEILGEVLAILDNPDGLHKLVNLPSGSAEGEIMKFLPVYFVYHYLETTNRWNIMGPEKYNHPSELKRKIREGITSIQSFRIPLKFSYSMWKDKEASTWLTAFVVKTLGQVDKYVKVDSVMLSNSIFWLINIAQNEDGSFTEYSTYIPVKLMEFGQAMRKAAMYVSNHAHLVKSMYARAVAAYALTLEDRDSMQSVMLYESLEKKAREKGEPVEYRYWQEKDVTQNPLTPDKTSAQMVETTAYVLLTALIKAKHQYAQPILNWLTQDQGYGGGFHSTQDTILTLEALAEYSKVIRSAKLDLLIEATYTKTKEQLGRISLNQKKPCYACNQTIGRSNSPADKARHLTLTQMSAKLFFLLRYKPRPNEMFTEASHTVMEIQLPTGVRPFQEDLNMFLNGLESVITDYKITEDMVVLQLDSVPSDQFICVGFRIQNLFQVGMVSASFFKVYEFNDRGTSQCSKLYSNSEAKLLRLCVGEQCHCMAAECCNFKYDMDTSITADGRKRDTCHDHIHYAFKVKIKSIVEEGDFITYVANMLNPLKMGLENHKINSELEFVKKASCTSVDMKTGGQYLIVGADRMQIQVGRSYKYRYPLDSQATVEVWPSECGGNPTCVKYVNILEQYAEDLLIEAFLENT
uniref:NTR domain-containing protein n=1 Tax=Esox lucius TaxID=8010 RepID=A0A6Q2Y1G6_ESOLU